MLVGDFLIALVLDACVIWYWYDTNERFFRWQYDILRELREENE